MSCINLEAQACGTPVITFSNTGVSETVKDGYGICVPTGDASAILASIKKMRLDGQTDTLRLVTQIRKEFEKKEAYRDYISLYQNFSK